MAVAATGPVMGLDSTSLQYTGVDIDDSSLEIASDILQIKADGVDDTHINWGTPGGAPSAGEVNGLDVPLTNAATQITATNVQDALEENRDAIDAIEDNTITSPNGSISVGGTIGGDDQTVDVVFSTAGASNRSIEASSLASTSNGQGASMIGIEDSGGLITATTVEGALAENRNLINSAVEGAIYRQPVWGGNADGDYLQGFVSGANDFVTQQICLILTAQPQTGDVINLNGTSYVAGTHFSIGGTLAATITNIAAALDGDTDFSAYELSIANIDGTYNCILIAGDKFTTLPTTSYLEIHGVAGTGNDWALGQPDYVQNAWEDSSGRTACPNTGTTVNFQDGEAGADKYTYRTRANGVTVMYTTAESEYVVVGPSAEGGDITELAEGNGISIATPTGPIPTISVDETYAFNFSGAIQTSGSTADFDSTTVGFSGTTVNFDGTTVNIDPTTTGFSGATVNFDGTTVNVADATVFNFNMSTGTSPFTVDSTTLVDNLNADLLDGVEASSFLRSDASDATSGAGITLTITSGDELDVAAGATADINGVFNAGDATSFTLPTSGITGAGHNSGLDADTVDGLQPTSFLRADASDTTAGTGITLTIASGDDLDINGDFAAGGATSFVGPTSGVSGFGAGSGLDADDLDGQAGSYYLDIANFTIASEAQGDILYYNGSSWTRLAAGTAGQFLETNGAGSNPSWGSPDTSSAEKVSVSGTAGAGGVAIRRLLYLDPSTVKYLQANGTSESTSHVAGAAEAAAPADAAVAVISAGKQSLELPSTHSLVTAGDYLYLAQEAGGYVVGKSDIAFTSSYIILPVALALETVSADTGGAISALIGAVGLHKFVN